MKYILTIIFSLALVSPVYASTYSGRVTTGVSTGNSTSVVVKVAPTATPAPTAGPFTNTQTVTLSAAGSDSIHYFKNTTDFSSALTCSTGTTTNPVIVEGSALIRAIACYGSIAGPMTSFSYKFTAPPATTPAAPTGGGGGGGYTPPPTVAQADFNSDGKVDILDFNILITNWGTTSGATKAMGDANNDGKVDIFDFNILINNWPTI